MRFGASASVIINFKEGIVARVGMNKYSINSIVFKAAERHDWTEGDSHKTRAEVRCELAIFDVVARLFDKRTLERAQHREHICCSAAYRGAHHRHRMKCPILQKHGESVAEDMQRHEKGESVVLQRPYEEG